MTTIDTDAIATGSASWAANLVTIGKLQDQIDVLQLNLQIATQQVALYRAELANTAALLRQERAMLAPLMAALFLSSAELREAAPA